MGQRARILTSILGFDGWKAKEAFFESAAGERLAPVGRLMMLRETRLVLVSSAGGSLDAGSAAARAAAFTSNFPLDGGPTCRGRSTRCSCSTRPFASSVPAVMRPPWRWSRGRPPTNASLAVFSSGWRSRPRRCR
jgi:hypothetical protein